ncbi:hypothetical protein D3C71_1486950 [compost metagenome]
MRQTLSPGMTIAETATARLTTKNTPVMRFITLGIRPTQSLKTPARLSAKTTTTITRG